MNILIKLINDVKALCNTIITAVNAIKAKTDTITADLQEVPHGVQEGEYLRGNQSGTQGSCGPAGRHKEVEHTGRTFKTQYGPMPGLRNFPHPEGESRCGDHGNSGRSPNNKGRQIH